MKVLHVLQMVEIVSYSHFCEYVLLNYMVILTHTRACLHYVHLDEMQPSKSAPRCLKLAVALFTKFFICHLPSLFEKQKREKTNEMKTRARHLVAAIFAQGFSRTSPLRPPLVSKDNSKYCTRYYYVRMQVYEYNGDGDGSGGGDNDDRLRRRRRRRSRCGWLFFFFFSFGILRRIKTNIR